MDRRRQLSGALAQYRPVGTDEATFRRRMLDLLAGPGDPFARDRFDPGHFTASAFVLADANHDLLMIHHRRLGRWLQPGGHVEQDDVDLGSAAQREVAEEAGLRGLRAVDPAPFDLDIHTIPARRGQPEHLHLDVRFLFRAPAHALSPASDAAAARWVALAQVARLNGETAMARVLDKLQALVPGIDVPRG